MKHRVVVAAQGQVVAVVYLQDGGAVGAVLDVPGARGQGINQRHPRLPSAFTADGAQQHRLRLSRYSAVAGNLGGRRPGRVRRSRSPIRDKHHAGRLQFKAGERK